MSSLLYPTPATAYAVQLGPRALQHSSDHGYCSDMAGHQHGLCWDLHMSGRPLPPREPGAMKLFSTQPLETNG